MSIDNIFTETLPASLLDDFLKRNCIKEMKTYRFNQDMFKRGVLNGNISTFCYELVLYYSPKKLHYIQRKHTYKTFLTVLRHVLKHFGVHYENHIKYDRSAYSIEYVIQYPSGKGKKGKGAGADVGAGDGTSGEVFADTNKVLSGGSKEDEVILDLSELKAYIDAE
jgi:hypothetical protein